MRAVLALLALVLATLAWLAWRPATQRSALRPEPVVVGATSTVVLEGDAAEAGAPRSAPVPLDAPAVPEPVVVEASEERELVVVVGEVVDAESGDPIAGAEATLVVPRPNGDPIPLARSDALGRLWAEVDPSEIAAGFGTRVSVVAAGTTRAERSVQLPASGELVLGRFVLRPAGAVVGTVQVPRSGERPEVSVEWRLASEASRELSSDTSFPVRGEVRPSARTDASGAYRLEGVPLGEGFLVVRGHHRLARSDLARVERGSELRVDVALEPEEVPLGAIEGRVLLPDGTPAGGAIVRLEPGFRSSVADADGRFRFVDDASHAYWIEVEDERAYPARLEGVRPGGPELVVQLEAPRWIEVELVEASGAPIPWGHVRAIVAGRGGAATIAAGREGVARVVRPRQAYELEAIAPGYRTQRFGPFDPDEPVDSRRLVLTPGQAVRGRVVVDGRPLDGASVSVFGTWDPEKPRISRDVAPGDDPFVLVGATDADSDASTDADGRFVATLHRDGWHGVRVEAKGFPICHFGPFEWSREAGVDGLVLELSRGGALAGRVTVAPGEDPSGRIVGASNGWSFVTTAHVDEEGRYRIEGLQPGGYQLRACRPPVGSVHTLRPHRAEAARFVPDVFVVPGETVSGDLDLTDEGAFVLEGRVVVGGVPAGAVNLEDAEQTFAKRLLGADSVLDGEFRLAAGSPGPFEVAAYLPTGATVRQVVELQRGVNDWRVDLPAGSLRLRAGSLEESQAVAVSWSSGDLHFRAMVFPESGDSADVVLVPVPEGRVEVQRYVRDDSGRGAWQTIGEVDVPEGGEAVFAREPLTPDERSR